MRHLTVVLFLLLGAGGLHAQIPVTGRVTCGERGVAGVVVTDGVRFAQTDRRGVYRLECDAEPVHVYLSLPAGYTAPVVGSVPMFWVRTDTLADRSAIDFSLLREPGSDRRHYFVVVGDPQVRNAAELKQLDTLLVALKGAVDKLPTTSTVPLLVAGDVVFNRQTMHTPSRKSFEAVEQPVFYAIGNHDHNPMRDNETYDNEEPSTRIFREHYGPTHYSFNRGQVHYIVLDNIHFRGGKKDSYEIAFGEEQLRWVENDLSYVPKDRAVVVMAHSPTQSRQFPSPAHYGDSPALHALLEDYAGVQIITGHTHYNSVVTPSERMTEHIVGAACGAFWEGPVCVDGTPLGYKIFEVDGRKFSWRYVDYKHPERLFTLFAPDSLRHEASRPAGEVVVNVWDWDPQWQVEYSEDGGRSYRPMPQATFADKQALDPEACAWYGVTGATRIPKRAWIKARTTDHLFFCTPQSKSITVRVTTRFGEQESQMMNW